MHFQKMLEGVVTDYKILRLFLCKKKKKKKRIQKAPSQFSAVSIFMFDSFLASSSAISWQKRLLFLLSVEQPFALHSFVAGHFLFSIKQQQPGTVFSSYIYWFCSKENTLLPCCSTTAWTSINSGSSKGVTHLFSMASLILY